MKRCFCIFKLDVLGAVSTVFLIIALTVVFTSVQLQASTESIFAPGDKSLIVIIRSVTATGPLDTDAINLYAAIATPERQVPGMGSGKVMKSADTTLTLSCVKRSDPNNVMCTLTIKPSPNSRVTSAQKFAEYRVPGTLAHSLSSQFQLGPGGSFAFTNQPGTLQILANNEDFWVRFQN